jgi:hypothetical protein
VEVTALDLEAIRRRSDLATGGGHHWMTYLETQVLDDVPALIAEVDRLRGELLAVTADLTAYWSQFSDVSPTSVGASGPVEHGCLDAPISPAAVQSGVGVAVASRLQTSPGAAADQDDNGPGATSPDRS